MSLVPLTTGTNLGQYEIVALLGQGGMGEVYRARDSRLGRDVALKILPDAFVHDPERVERFRREAQVLASLNHANIGAIHGFERADPSAGSGQAAVQFLVLELVEGETLAHRIARGQLPIDEALAIARQMCDALEAAHEQGIVHRDLKPANIVLHQTQRSDDVVVKVLDFGLAKVAEADASRAGLTNSPTMMLASMPGTILGTAAYMAPEQAKGLTIDRRADIFAFGSVLYEMLTGRQAFPGDTVPEILAAVLKTEPDWGRLPAGTPPSIRKLLRRCLEKDRGRRLQNAGDVRLEIDDALAERSTGDEGVEIARTKTRPIGRRGSLYVGLVAVVAALVAGLAAWTLKPGVTSNRLPVARLTVALPPGDTLQLVSPSVALSPDGRRLAYSASRAGGALQLFVRPIDSLEITPLSGTEGAIEPFFSPDGRWIGFFAQGKLKKVLAAGGGLQTLCDAASGMGGTWGTDDSIYFAPFNTSGIWKVSASGGAPQAVTRLNRTQGEVSHRWPQVLPDGKTVLFTVWTGPGWDEKHLELQIGDSGERRVLVRGASTGRYVSSGHLLYARAEEMVVVPFDVANLRVTGPPVTLADRASEQSGEGAQYAVSNSGTLAYIPSGSSNSDRRLVWVGADGHVEPVPAPPNAYTDPAVSPDGRSVAVSIQGPTQTIWIYDIARSTLTTLPSMGSSQAPVWTPDGRRLVYRGTRAGYRNVFWRAADGAGEEERLTTGETMQTPTSLSSDGMLLFFVDTAADTGADMLMMRLDGGRQPQVVLRTRSSEAAPLLSPDGRWLAYSSNESGRGEIYVRPFPNAGGKFAISTGGGSEPRWSRDGRELFYRNGDKMMAVAMASGSIFTAGSARLLFEGQYQVNDAGAAGYDVSPDRRFLMIEPTALQQPATRINVVLNWFDDVNAHVGAAAR